MINKITIHCSASPQGRGDNAETIHRWHRERGWSGIGYHYVIVESGELQRGRPEYWKGAHAKNHNTGNIGICLIGNDFFTEEQYKTLEALLLKLVIKYPGVTIKGHYFYDTHKTCPNFDVEDYLDSIGL